MGKTHCVTLRLMPFECVLGHQPPLCPWDGENVDIPTLDNWFQRAEEVWETAHTTVSRAMRRFKRNADRHRREVPEFQALNQGPLYAVTFM